MQKVTKQIIDSYNNPDTLGIISSYPSFGGEVARGNAISRYTYLLTNNFPKSQKVIVFCEIRNTKKPFLMAQNILVVPTYKLNSINFFRDLLSKFSKFDVVSNILIEFEFSIFGGKIIIPQLMALLASFKLMGKSVKIMFHQVVDDINVLSGHLAIKKYSLKAWVLNNLLDVFYKTCGILSEKVFVHDAVLAGRLEKFVDEGKIKVIPHGVGGRKVVSKTFASNSKRYFKIKNGTKLVGIFGYCSWYKGTDWLIENFARFARENSNQKIRLLVAGGESPTLKGTLAYKKYHNKLKKVIKEANGNIVYTGYVPDSDVKKVFGAVDLFIFPYRTKMSASGAFSLCQSYNKPYIVSKAFSENVPVGEVKGRVFDLNYKSFAKLLKREIGKKESENISAVYKTWAEVGDMYLKESLSERQTLPRLSYAEVSEA